MTILRFIVVLLFTALTPVMVSAAGVSVASTLGIVTASGEHHFSVEVMRSQPELERGLMFRRQMVADHGMLFDFGTPQEVSMWMKNTYLALDMLFIDQQGRIVSVARNAVPLSETVISSHGLVTGVLEINAGIADKIDVKPGDIVHHPIFSR